MISTELGEVGFEPGCHIRRGRGRGTAEMTLSPGTLEYLHATGPALAWPDGACEDQGHPLVTMPGLRWGYSWGP